jgi:hypothetical protein
LKLHSALLKSVKVKISTLFDREYLISIVGGPIGGVEIENGSESEGFI